tara:strand:- start:121 stop:318 length:198 start_codon:yes stop_codon:yes gene_type:complete
MIIINDMIDRWCSSIKRPIQINNKSGFVLNSGIVIIFDDSHLTQKSKERLSRHYIKLKKKESKNG